MKKCYIWAAVRYKRCKRNCICAEIQTVPVHTAYTDPWLHNCWAIVVLSQNYHGIVLQNFVTWWALWCVLQLQCSGEIFGCVLSSTVMWIVDCVCSKVVWSVMCSKVVTSEISVMCCMVRWWWGLWCVPLCYSGVICDMFCDCSGDVYCLWSVFSSGEICDVFYSETERWYEVCDVVCSAVQWSLMH